MSLRNRIGTFFLLTAALFLFIFAASAFSPSGNYEVIALLAGAVLLVVGFRWRLAKGGRPPAAARAPAPAAGKPPPPKKQGALTTLLKGPVGMKKTAPKGPPGPGANAAPKGSGGGGKPAGGGGGGKPAGGKPGGATGRK